MSELSNKIRFARRNSNLSQKELSKEVGVFVTTISAYETGRAVPPWKTLQKIANITGFALDYFTEETVMNNKEVIQLSKKIAHLKKIRRQGWVSKGIPQTESVADHVFLVSILTMLLSKGRRYNREKVIKIALVHDVGEVLTGDIIYERGIKEAIPLKLKSRKEKKAMREIFKKFDDKEEYFALWDEWIKQKTSEAKFVRLIEKLEMIIQAFKYERESKTSKVFDEFWENAEKYLKGSELESLYNALVSEREKLHKKK